MVTKLKSALRIPRQQLLLAVRAAVFASSLWLLADREFSTFQLAAFIIIGAVLYFTPVFQTLLIFPSFLALMIIAPIAMSVFGPQVDYPLLLAAFFGLLFYLILGIKQVVFVSRIKLHHALHLALLYGISILFFAAPGADWFVARSLALGLLVYMLVRELFLFQGMPLGARLKLLSAVVAFLFVEAVWALGLLPIGFINAAGALLIFGFTLEQLLLLTVRGGITRRSLMLELATFVVLLVAILRFSTWSLP